MLIEFSVANYLSYHGRASLTLEATPDTSLPGNVVETGNRDLRLLKSAVLCGANATGKSNLLRAMDFLFTFVRTSHKDMKRGYLPLSPFRMDPGCLEKPSTFEVTFLAGDTRYVYGIEADAKLVHREWLASYPDAHRRKLFERTLDPISRTHEVAFGRSWKGPRKKLAAMVPPASLLLSHAAETSSETAQEVFDFFRHALVSIDTHMDFLGIQNTLWLAHTNPEDKQAISRLLKLCDPQIESIILKKVKLQDIAEYQRLSERQKRLFENFYKSRDFDALAMTLRRMAVDDKGLTHTAPFDLGEESHGIKQLVTILGIVLSSLSMGGIQGIDDFGSHMHPLIKRILLSLFHSQESNPRHTQFVCTTHDLGLLDAELVRRDQIWLTERDDLGATRLSSLRDIKNARKGEAIRKRIIGGMYFGIPAHDEVEPDLLQGALPSHANGEAAP